jgi:hypothetical protein
MRQMALDFVRGTYRTAREGVSPSLVQGDDWRAMVQAMRIAVGEGQLKTAEALSRRLSVVTRQAGVAETWNGYLALAAAEMGAGDMAKSHAKLTTPQSDPNDYLLAAATIGDLGSAQKALTQRLAERPLDTLLHEPSAPLIRAEILLRQGRVAAAARAVAGIHQGDFPDFQVAYRVGCARLAASDAAGAAAAFSEILRDPGLEVDNLQYPVLAHLGLARAYRRQGDIAGSRREYEAFLARWKDADQDLPILVAAKMELANLPKA